MEIDDGARSGTGRVSDLWRNFSEHRVSFSLQTESPLNGEIRAVGAKTELEGWLLILFPFLWISQTDYQS